MSKDRILEESQSVKGPNIEKKKPRREKEIEQIKIEGDEVTTT